MMLIHKCSSVENVERSFIHSVNFNNILGDMNKIKIGKYSSSQEVAILQRHQRGCQLVIVLESSVSILVKVQV